MEEQSSMLNVHPLRSQCKNKEYSNRIYIIFFRVLRGLKPTCLRISDYINKSTEISVNFVSFN